MGSFVLHRRENIFPSRENYLSRRDNIYPHRIKYFPGEINFDPCLQKKKSE
jgi:hypothetical protein